MDIIEKACLPEPQTQTQNALVKDALLKNGRTIFLALSLKHIEKGGKLFEIVRAQSTLSSMFARIGTAAMAAKQGRECDTLGLLVW
jgi:hypothetical protein